MKSKADQILRDAWVIEAAELRVDANVKFKEGTQLAGTVGRIGAINPDGTIMVMVGKALQGPFAPGDVEVLDMIQNFNAPGPASVGAPAVVPTA